MSFATVSCFLIISYASSGVIFLPVDKTILHSLISATFRCSPDTYIRRSDLVYYRIFRWRATNAAVLLATSRIDSRRPALCRRRHRDDAKTFRKCLRHLDSPCSVSKRLDGHSCRPQSFMHVCFFPFLLDMSNNYKLTDLCIHLHQNHFRNAHKI